jgi:hypothetical protein
MSKECIHEDEQGQETGHPPNLPAHHDQKAGHQLERAEHDGPCGRWHACNDPSSHE